MRKTKRKPNFALVAFKFNLVRYPMNREEEATRNHLGMRETIDLRKGQSPLGGTTRASWGGGHGRAGLLRNPATANHWI